MNLCSYPKVDAPYWRVTSTCSLRARQGRGGQNVNKVETKVLLRLDLSAITELYGEMMHARVSKALHTRLDKEGRLLVSCESTRSQYRNWCMARERLVALLEQAMFVQKRRRPTKPSRGAVKRRLNNKKRQSDKKKERRQRFD